MEFRVQRKLLAVPFVDKTLGLALCSPKSFNRIEIKGLNLYKEKSTNLDNNSTCIAKIHHAFADTARKGYFIVSELICSEGIETDSADALFIRKITTALAVPHTATNVFKFNNIITHQYIFQNSEKSLFLLTFLVKKKRIQLLYFVPTDSFSDISPSIESSIGFTRIP